MNCVHCGETKRVQRHGQFRRSSDSKTIQRYHCKNCWKTFSTAVFCDAYRQKKRRINWLLLKLLSSGVSQRRAAIILGVSRKTIERRIPYLGRICRRDNAKDRLALSTVLDIQFDELQTIEHSKCKPLSVPVCVVPKTRFILGASVCRIPATGNLSEISLKKYGRRPNDRNIGITRLFASISHTISHETTISSDKHVAYPKLIKSCFGKIKHKTFKGKKSTVAGQGELKKAGRDPLFYINHTLAMLRANINRLFRKTWCTTKDPTRFQDHLEIYIWFHNHRLIPKANRA